MTCQLTIFMEEDLISQLQNIPTELKKLDESETNILSDPSQVEQFVILNSTKLIERSLETIESVRSLVDVAPDAENVTALANLINSSTKAVEALNKIIIQNKKDKNALEVKKAEIVSKEVMQEKDHELKTFLSRNEILKMVDGRAKDEES